MRGYMISNFEKELQCKEQSSPSLLSTQGQNDESKNVDKNLEAEKSEQNCSKESMKNDFDFSPNMRLPMISNFEKGLQCKEQSPPSLSMSMQCQNDESKNLNKNFEAEKFQQKISIEPIKDNSEVCKYCKNSGHSIKYCPSLAYRKCQNCNKFGHLYMYCKEKNNFNYNTGFGEQNLPSYWRNPRNYGNPRPKY